MKCLTCGLLLMVSAGLGFAQQPAQPSGPPPYTTPPTFPQDQTPPGSVPPDTKAPAKPLSTAQVKQQIQEKLATEPDLQKTPIQAKVNNHSVVLKGTVENARQHDLAVRIAQSFAGERSIVDHIKTREASQ
jgi:BON domain